MSSPLRSAAESTAHVLESTAHVLSDLVEEARGRIEELPPIARARRKRKTTRWPAVAIAMVVALGLVWLLSHRHQHADEQGPANRPVDETRRPNKTAADPRTDTFEVGKAKSANN
jgi:hypothetical protein